jgi:hypothetical protein
MRERKSDIAAPIPPSLSDADELLRRYGRWAMNRNRKHQCGSAEGNYRSPPNDDDREPREMLMTMLDALQCQRALSRVPDPQRIVLAILYVPQRLPPAVQLRMLHIPPKLSQERHLDGLRMFRNLHGTKYSM